MSSFTVSAVTPTGPVGVTAGDEGPPQERHVGKASCLIGTWTARKWLKSASNRTRRRGVTRYPIEACPANPALRLWNWSAGPCATFVPPASATNRCAHAADGVSSKMRVGTPINANRPKRIMEGPPTKDFVHYSPPYRGSQGSPPLAGQPSRVKY